MEHQCECVKLHHLVEPVPLYIYTGCCSADLVGAQWPPADLELSCHQLTANWRPGGGAPCAAPAPGGHGAVVDLKLGRFEDNQLNDPLVQVQVLKEPFHIAELIIGLSELS